MRPVSGKDLCRVLERNWWAFARVSGSHHVYRRSGTPRQLCVPVGGKAPLKRGLVAFLLKAAQLTEADLWVT